MNKELKKIGSTAPILLDGDQVLPHDSGGKVTSLNRLMSEGLRVPKTLFLPQSAYSEFLRNAGLLQNIQALADERTDSLRWEEIWDAALYLRNNFSRSRIPQEVEEVLLGAVEANFGNVPLAFRSCAQQEDSGYSHAGMHDSILDVVGNEGILKAVKLVWASLWTDRAIMYRREMGLDPKKSAMGVIIQAMVPGEISGVMFTQSPTDEAHCIIEAASGPASNIVDDLVETERVVLSRSTGNILSQNQRQGSTLSEALIQELYELGRRAEKIFTAPQDIEWTVADGELILLQSRPVTTLVGSGDENGWNAEDVRPWYLSLTRSHKNLLELKGRIEDEILPSMYRESQELKANNLDEMDCEALAQELARREKRLSYWRDTYWRELIPFAHAVRQLGMLYNDAVGPSDPFEFTTLLTGQHLLALERNSLLREMAQLVVNDTELADRLRHDIIPSEGAYADKLHEFMARFGDLSCSTSWCDEGPRGIVRLTLDPDLVAPRKQSIAAKELEERYLSAFTTERREFAESVLELARASYRLRDDDNIYLGRIQARYDEVKAKASECRLIADETAEARKATPKGHAWTGAARKTVRDSSLQGWAAAAGIARGSARVITNPNELFSFKKGEILVCDALDPNMTFVVPLAAAIVERRGGMLVHGAIIAREYGIPCVTGIADATSLFRTGEKLTVDGFRGVVERGQDLDKADTDQLRNVLGGLLVPCCDHPMTGFFRSGRCASDPMDMGKHVVCAQVTEEFLAFTRAQGNDLTTPQPESRFPGLVPGDKWCLCSGRWEEARKAGVAPPVILEATHEAALEDIKLEYLLEHSSKKVETGE